MKIESLWFKNHTQGWEIEEVHFNEDLNLLVGVSGAGKTQILVALFIIQNIAKNFNKTAEVSFRMNFLIESKSYKWEAELKGNEDFIFFEREIIAVNQSVIFKRENGDILFEEKKMPKLNQKESMLHLFDEPINIEIIEGIEKINYILVNDNFYNALSPIQITDRDQVNNFYNKKDISLHFIQNNNFSTIEKLLLVYLHRNKFDTFDYIKESFSNIFPQVSDLIINWQSNLLLKKDFKIYISIQVDSNWIHQENISLGMLKSLLLISELYLSADGSVFLIDEFENSLGINCIDVLTENVLQESGRMQFIITSHHPYIIENVDTIFWKIVTRKGGKIKVHDAAEFDLGKSHHEKFFQLINLKEYREGIQV